MPVPPSNEGGDQLTVAEALPEMALTFVAAGGSGNLAAPVSQRTPGSLGHGSAPAPEYPQGSTAVQELVMYTPKCRCGPLLHPVFPLCPMLWAGSATCPTPTASDARGP